MQRKNNKIEIAAWGSPFSHDICSCAGEMPKNHEWIFDRVSKSGISVYMDYNILGGIESTSKYNYLWLCESRAVTPQQTEYVKNNYSNLLGIYRKIFVHNYDLLKLHASFEYVPPAANFTWVKERKIYEKNKLISMISSGKNFTESHRKRNNFLNRLSNQYKNIDYYGRYFNPFGTKEEVLSDYMFSIAIENDNYSNYYTEKIMDCFATGTIPIYSGTPEISKLFDQSGIIILTEEFDPRILTAELYFSKINAIHHNFEISLSHKIADDVLYEKIMVDV
jgi:hypothetical protein